MTDRNGMYATCKVTVYGWYDDGGYRYYYDTNGNMVTGWWENSEGRKYYFRTAPNTPNPGPTGAMLRGCWAKIGNHTYRFERSNPQYAGKNPGQLLRNQWWDNSAGDRYRLGEESGRRLESTFYTHSNGYRYRLGGSGKLLKNTFFTDTSTKNRYRYRLGKTSGRVVTGWWKKEPKKASDVTKKDIYYFRKASNSSNHPTGSACTGDNKNIDGVKYRFKQGTPNKGKVLKVYPNKITVSTSNTTVKVDKTRKLKVKVEPKMATDKSITWKSSNDKIVKITKSSNSGATIKAVKPGNVKITARSKSDSTVVGSINIKVPGYKATVNNYYDLGYHMFYYNDKIPKSNSADDIDSYMKAVAERYDELFGLKITKNKAKYFESAIDTCKGTVTKDNIDNFCTHPDPHTTLYNWPFLTSSWPNPNTVYVDFSKRVPTKGDNKTTNVLWSCHGVKEFDGNERMADRSFSLKTSVHMIDRFPFFGSGKKFQFILMHELNHQYDGKDHYHEEAVPGDESSCINKAICSDCGKKKRPESCVMYSDYGRYSDISKDTIICEPCYDEIKAHLKKHHQS